MEDGALCLVRMISSISLSVLNTCVRGQQSSSLYYLLILSVSSIAAIRCSVLYKDSLFTELDTR